jgi:hypothetical protein
MRDAVERLLWLAVFLVACGGPVETSPVGREDAGLVANCTEVCSCWLGCIQQDPDAGQAFACGKACGGEGLDCGEVAVCPKFPGT